MPEGRGGGVNSVVWGFSPTTPSTTPTHGHFLLSRVSLALTDQVSPLEKIGDCVQSDVTFSFFFMKYCISKIRDVRIMWVDYYGKIPFI